MTTSWANAPEAWQESLRLLEFSRVLERLARHCETPMGAAWAEGLTPLEEDAALRERYQAVREAMQWLYQENPTLAGAAAIEGWAELAARGGRLTGEQLAAVARTVAIGAQLRRRLGQGRYPRLRQLFDGVALPEELHAAIAAQIDEHGAVRDEATPKLYSLRRQIAALEEEIDQVLAQILHHPAWAPYLQEPVVTIRFGRKVVPVKAEYRSQVRGLVHDQSGSGQTVFVEPLEVVTRQNRLTYLGR
ncbi:MAG: endonuclease MutS2, partial [Firmicutes bacterium]|nr:endonuclease MutS2 [Bacillota bacterium]